MENIFSMCDTVGMVTTGALIRRYRLAAGLTQKELACRIGMTDRRITAWESQGEEPGREALQKLAQVFGIKIDDLATPTLDAAVDSVVDAAIGAISNGTVQDLRERAALLADALARYPGRLDRWITYGQGLLDGIDIV